MTMVPLSRFGPGGHFAFQKSELLLQCLFGSAKLTSFASAHLNEYRVSNFQRLGVQKFGETKNITKSKFFSVNPLKTLKTAKEIFGIT